MDLSEVIDGGFQPGDVVMRIDRDQAKMYDDYTPAQVSELKHYKDNIYYVEVTYPDGRVAMPISTPTIRRAGMPSMTILTRIC